MCGQILNYFSDYQMLKKNHVILNYLECFQVRQALLQTFSSKESIYWNREYGPLKESNIRITIL
jgi:hypothetical protein